MPSAFRDTSTTVCSTPSSTSTTDTTIRSKLGSPDRFKIPETRGSLAWYQSRRERWLNSPRTRTQPLIAKKADVIVSDSTEETSEKTKEQGQEPTESADEQKSVDVSSSAAQPLKDNVKAEPTLSHRDRLINFYEKYNPEKVATVDKTLVQYSGKEKELFEKLRAKYVTKQASLPEPAGPTCFLDIRCEAQNPEDSFSGRITIRLFQDQCPLACNNFRALCTGETGVGRSQKRRCYRQSKFHRVVPNFCIQGGDYTKHDGTGGESIYSPSESFTDLWGNFKDELFLDHTVPGLLSMANNGRNRNSSQFFVTLKPLPHLNGKHVVFGKVVDGMSVVQRIGGMKTNPETQRPLQSVVIEDCGEILVDGSEVSASSTENQKDAKPSIFGGFGTSKPKADSGSASPFSFGSGTVLGTANKGDNSTAAQGTYQGKIPTVFGSTFGQGSFGSSPKTGGETPTTVFGSYTKSGDVGSNISGSSFESLAAATGGSSWTKASLPENKATEKSSQQGFEPMTTMTIGEKDPETRTPPVSFPSTFSFNSPGVGQKNLVFGQQPTPDTTFKSPAFASPRERAEGTDYDDDSKASTETEDTDGDESSGSGEYEEDPRGRDSKSTDTDLMLSVGCLAVDRPASVQEKSSVKSSSATEASDASSSAPTSIFGQTSTFSFGMTNESAPPSFGKTASSGDKASGGTSSAFGQIASVGEKTAGPPNIFGSSKKSPTSLSSFGSKAVEGVSSFGFGQSSGGGSSIGGVSSSGTAIFGSDASQGASVFGFGNNDVKKSSFGDLASSGATTFGSKGKIEGTGFGFNQSGSSGSTFGGLASSASASFGRRKDGPTETSSVPMSPNVFASREFSSFRSSGVDERDVESDSDHSADSDST